MPSGEKRFYVRKKDEPASNESRALAVFLGDLNSSSEFGDGGFESSRFERSLFFL